MSLGRALDSLIAAPFPGWAARRAQARARMTHLASYEAAVRDRTDPGGPTSTKSADGSIIPDQAMLNARARDAARNDWTGVSIIDAKVRHIVGTGITVRPRAVDLVTREPFAAFNLAAREIYNRWARTAKWCDVEQRKTVRAMQQLNVRERTVVGECFTILNYTPRPDMVGLSLQMIEYEQLDLSKSRNPQTRFDILNGIEINDFGAPVALWVYVRRHPLNDYRARLDDVVRVPFERVLQYMRQDRCRQTHGVTRFAPVLSEMRHRRMYDDYTLLRAQAEACNVYVEEEALDAPAGPQDLGTIGGGSPDTQYDTDAGGNPQYNVEPAQVWRARPGKTLKSLALTTPNGQYAAFQRQHINQIAAGAGLDYPTVSRDYSKNNYSGQRQGLMELWRDTDPEQLDLIDVFCRPVYEAFVTAAVMEGRLAAPGFFIHDELRETYLEADYRGPAKYSLDEEKTAKARQINIEQRLTTRGRLLNTEGEDAHETFAEIREENTLADSAGISLPENAAKPEPAPMPAPEAPLP